MFIGKLEPVENTLGDDLIAFVRAVNSPDAQFKRTVADGVRAEYSRKFDQQAFAPLAPSTVADRIRQGYGATPILVREGNLLRSYTVGGANGHVERITSDGRGITIEVGSGHRLAGIHEGGTSRTPARPVSNFGSDGQDRLLDMVHSAVQRIERGILGR